MQQVDTTYELRVYLTPTSATCSNPEGSNKDRNNGIINKIAFQ